MNDVIQAYEDKYLEGDQARAEELFALMDNNGWLFAQRITLTNSTENYYYNYPIVNKIDADKFSQKLCEINISSANSILIGLFNRYSMIGHINMYSVEKTWFDEVERCINENILPSANRLMKARINLKILPKILKIKEKANN